MHVILLSELLRTCINYRDYSNLCEVVERIIQEEGWDGFLRYLSDQDLGIHQINVRDALVHLTGLSCTSGLDIDMVAFVEQFNPDSVKSLQREVIPIAIEQIRQQIANGNIFFMNTEAMSDTGYAIIVHEIIRTCMNSVAW